MDQRIISTSLVSMAALAAGAANAAVDDFPFVITESYGQVSGVVQAYQNVAPFAKEDASFVVPLDSKSPVFPLFESPGGFAKVPTAFAASQVFLQANLDTPSNARSTLTLIGESGGDSVADQIEADAQTSAEYFLGYRMMPTTPVYIRLRLGEGTLQGSGQYYVWGDYFFRADGEEIVVEAGTEVVEIDRLYQPGTPLDFRMTAFAGGTGRPDATNFYVYTTASFEVLAAYEGTLELGDNPFDRNDPPWLLFDMTGICDPGSFGGDGLWDPIYFQFTPMRSGSHTFSTCNQAQLDTRIAITDGPPIPEATIACGDSTPGCANFTGEVSVELEAGVTYTVVLGSTYVTNPAANEIGTITVSLDGDLNFDNIVDGGDIGMLIGNWGGSGVGDLNRDGRVDSADLGLLLGFFSG